MGRMSLFVAGSAWLALATPSAAQEAPPAPCALCTPVPAKPGTTATAPSVAVRLDVETSLDFDRLVLTGPAGGAAQLRPDGSTISSGAVEMSGRAMVGTARIHGEAGRPVRIDMPDRIVMDGVNGGQIVIADLTTDLAAMPQLDSAGELQFRFGGTLRVMGDAEGNYRGDVAITVDYL
jgi:Domain of unknown function (DUF4402)